MVPLIVNTSYPGALMNGLVNHVVPEDKLDEKTDEMIAKILNNSRSVMALGKRAFYKQITEDIPTAYK